MLAAGWPWLGVKQHHTMIATAADKLLCRAAPPSVLLSAVVGELETVGGGFTAAVQQLCNVATLPGAGRLEGPLCCLLAS